MHNSAILVSYYIHLIELTIAKVNKHPFPNYVFMFYVTNKTRQLCISETSLFFLSHVFFCNSITNTKHTHIQITFSFITGLDVSYRSVSYKIVQIHILTVCYIYQLHTTCYPRITCSCILTIKFSLLYI